MIYLMNISWRLVPLEMRQNDKVKGHKKIYKHNFPPHTKNILPNWVVLWKLRVPPIRMKRTVGNRLSPDAMQIIVHYFEWLCEKGFMSNVAHIFRYHCQLSVPPFFFSFPEKNEVTFVSEYISMSMRANAFFSMPTTRCERTGLEIKISECEKKWLLSVLQFEFVRCFVAVDIESRTRKVLFQFVLSREFC